MSIKSKVSANSCCDSVQCFPFSSNLIICRNGLSPATVIASSTVMCLQCAKFYIFPGNQKIGILVSVQMFLFIAPLNKAAVSDSTPASAGTFC